MSRPRRLEGVSYCGPAQYFLTFCTLNRSQVFLETANVAPVLWHIRRTAALESFAILAYCFMPDHVHLLVEGITSGCDLRRFVKLAKQRSGAAYALRHRQRLWQEGYYERVLRRNEDARTVARYIILNPVRAGLVKQAREYPLLGSDCWPLDVLIESLDP